MSTGLLYLATIAAATTIALGLTPLAMRAAVRWDLLDHGGDRKGDRPPVPYLGGPVMAAGFCLAIGTYAVMRPLAPVWDEVGAMILAAFVLSIVGLVDDIRGLSPGARLAMELLAALAMWQGGIRVELFELWPADLLLTALWVVGITNAFNLLDNMDGLSAGVAAIAGASFFAIAAINGQFLVASLSLAVVGGALGFLRHNFPPARIYMGDSGSLFLGFLLAAIGVKLRFDAPRTVTFLVPVLVLAVPMTDTVLVVVTRLRRGVSPFQAGRDHVSHRLRRAGLSERAAVGGVYAATLVTGTVALVLSASSPTVAWVLAAIVAASLTTAGVWLAGIPATGPLTPATSAVEEQPPVN